MRDFARHYRVGVLPARPFSPTRSDRLEIIDDRAGTRATIVTSQLPVEHWHAWIGDATITDAILDRLLSRSQRLALKRKSLRAGKQASPTSPADPVAAQHPTKEARQDPMS